jgi:hypothetical protein
VEPDGLASDPPTRFIGREMLGVTDVVLDVFVSGPQSPADS